MADHLDSDLMDLLESYMINIFWVLRGLPIDPVYLNVQVISYHETLPK